MSKLLSPLTIREVTFRNRIVMSPMCQYSAVNGFTGDWHKVHLGTRAVGGTGLIFMEATAVSPEGRISHGDAGLWSDEHVPGLQSIVSFVDMHGAVAGIQLAHAGRKASCAVPWEGSRQLSLNEGGWQTLAPSGIPYLEGERPPAAMDLKAVGKVIADYRAAAGRALSAGFRVLEIHAAHGYLIHEFLSPLSNRRNDEYGGSFENRIRLLCEVVEAVRSEWPHKLPLFVRISSTDWTAGGWTPEESVKLAALLRDREVDLIDCSAGGNVHNTRITAGPGYLVPFSEAVRKTGVLTGTVGFITTPAQAEAILQEEKADLVFLARELLRNPYFALQAAKELAVETEWPRQYARAK